MIEIKNLRNEKPRNEWDVRVDRTSILGNPFKMRNESERDAVCEEYKEYFFEKILEPGFYQEVLRLKNIHDRIRKLNLFCWCSPKRCHAETIKKYIEEEIK